MLLKKRPQSVTCFQILSKQKLHFSPFKALAKKQTFSKRHKSFLKNTKLDSDKTFSEILMQNF